MWCFVIGVGFSFSFLFFSSIEKHPNWDCFSSSFFFSKEFVLSFGRDREKSGKIGKTCNVYYSLSRE